MKKLSLDRVDKKIIDGLCYEIIGAAIEVHKELGPGLLESIYEYAMVEELTLRGLNCDRQKSLPVFYKGKELTPKFKLDLIIEDLIIVELKTVSEVLPIHEAQLLSYLKLIGAPKGLIINFNVKNVSKHVISIVSEYFKEIPERLA